MEPVVVLLHPDLGEHLPHPPSLHDSASHPRHHQRIALVNSRLHLTAHHPRYLLPPQLRHTMPELFKAHVLAPAVEDVVDQAGSQPAQAHA